MNRTSQPPCTSSKTFLSSFLWWYKEQPDSLLSIQYNSNCFIHQTTVFGCTQHNWEGISIYWISHSIGNFHWCGIHTTSTSTLMKIFFEYFADAWWGLGIGIEGLNAGHPPHRSGGEHSIVNGRPSCAGAYSRWIESPSPFYTTGNSSCGCQCTSALFPLVFSFGHQCMNYRLTSSLSDFPNCHPYSSAACIWNLHPVIFLLLFLKSHWKKTPWN